MQFYSTKLFWELTMCQAPWRLYNCRHGPDPQKAHNLEARGATQSLVVLAFSFRRTCPLWGECLQWHFLAYEAGLGCFCPAVQRGLSELGKYKRFPSPVCILTLLSELLPPSRLIALFLFLLFLSSIYFSFFTIFLLFSPVLNTEGKFSRYEEVCLQKRHAATATGAFALMGPICQEVAGVSLNWELGPLSSQLRLCYFLLVTLSLSPIQVEPECLS